MGDKTLILREYEDDEGRPAVGFMRPMDFRLYKDNERYFEGDREVGIGDLWLRHPDRRDYSGIVFAPAGWGPGGAVAPDIPPAWYNLWKGYTVDPAPFYDDPRDHARHFPTLFDHILRNVARGDRDLARYVWGWFAHMIQRPTERPGVGLVLRGKQGSGKTSPGDIIGGLLGEHYVLIDHPEHLVGKFNPHMVKCLFLQADEGFWAGDKTAEGRLKGMLTSRSHQIEKKGVDPVSIRNYIRLLVSSNNAWVVPAGLEERRWAVLDVGNDNMQDRAFFAQMYGEIERGGREHLLSYLLRFDLSKVVLTDLPKTAALFEQKVASMSEVQSWWFERLREGVVLETDDDWQKTIATKALYDSYRTYADKLGKMRKLTVEQFGMQLGDLMPEGFARGKKMWEDRFEIDPSTNERIKSRNYDGSWSRKRVNCYHLPSLTACREHFCGLVRYQVDWGEGEADDGAAGNLGNEWVPDDPFAL